MVFAERVAASVPLVGKVTLAPSRRFLLRVQTTALDTECVSQEPVSATLASLVPPVRPPTASRAA